MPRRPLLLLALLACLLVGAAGCASDDTPSEATSPEARDAADPAELADPACGARATVDGISYHVVKASGSDYGLDPTTQVTGTVTDCRGENRHQLTFHALPDVDPTWALCGMVGGTWRVFLADDLGPVPASSPLTRIVLGD